MLFIRTDGGIQGNLIADRISYPSYVRRNFPNVSWGTFPPLDFLESFDIFPLVQDEAPSFNPETERRTTLSSIYDSQLGGWKGNYQVVMIPQEELDEEERNRIQSGLSQIRNQRDEILRGTDWIMNADAPVENKNQWKAYRQQLRDITLGLKNPDNVRWPSPPNIVPSASKISENYSGVFNPLGSN